MTKDEIIASFLGRGYFPAQLPPGFDTKSFATSYPVVSKAWPKKQPDTRLDRFSVLRSLYSRRMTGIPNPIAYYRLVHEIASYWPNLESHFKKSKISLTQPQLADEGRAISITKFRELDEIRVLKSSGYRYVLVSDISRYFPTIYTHVIPWAIHGKEDAKKNIGNVTPAYYGNILDVKSQGLQSRQTIGLPIGPDTSHVLAEVIGTAIDCELEKALGSWPDGYRYVDDYCLFFQSREQAERTFAVLSRAFTKFELQVNADKTRVLECKDLMKESWPHRLKNYEIGDAVSTQRANLHRFFSFLYELEQQYRDEKLVKYGLKVISTQIVKRPNWNLFEAYLLKFAHAFPNAVEVIVRIFETYQFHSYPINSDAVSRFCETFISQHSLTDGHSEVAWALWLALRTKVKVSKGTVSAALATGNSVCLILLLHLESLSLTEKKLKKRDLKQYASSRALTEENWLLAYEAGRRKWLRNVDLNFISTDAIFAPLLAANVQFYLDSIPVSPIFSLKEGVVDQMINWDSDQDIDEFFDFEETAEDYSEGSPNEISNEEDFDIVAIDENEQNIDDDEYL